MSSGGILHKPGRGAVGDALDHFVPVRILLGWEIRAVEEFLKAEYLDVLMSGVFDHREVFIDHSGFDPLDGTIVRLGIGGLNETASDYS
jgi:hypothetical protein